MKLRCILADDEPLARQRLCDLIDGVTWLALVGQASDGPSAIELIDRTRPDVAFLDIEMPGLFGLEVLTRIRHRPHVVFTTAHDRYAVTAFDLQAIDYLQKPFGRERFSRAARRALELSELQATENGHSGPQRIDRIFVHERGRVLTVSVDEVAWLEGLDDYVAVHASEARHLVSTRLHEFEARLDPARFVRVHRSHIVNLDHVHSLERIDGGRVRVHLRSGAVVPASRTGSRRLRKLDPLR